MKNDVDVPQYSDVVTFTCLFYPLISASIGFMVLGAKNAVGIGAGALVFCFLVYLPFASLAFACIRKKVRRARACMISAFAGLMSVYLILGIVAYGQMGPHMDLLGAGIGLLILLAPYVLSCVVYFIALKRAVQFSRTSDQSKLNE